MTQLYRYNYESLVDDPDFQELSPLAQAVFHTMKLKLGQYGIGVFYAAVLQEHHRRATSDELVSALEELQAVKPSGSAPWVARARNVFWIRNGLRFDPALSMGNPNHAKGALRAARALPASLLVEEFIDYYEIRHADEVVSGRPKKTEEIKSLLNPISPASEITEKEMEKEKETEKRTSSSPSGARADVKVESGEVDVTQIAIATQLERHQDRVALGKVCAAAPDAAIWLGEMAAALNSEGEYRGVSGRVLGDVLRTYVGNGNLRDKPPKFSLFIGYLRNAGNPPRRSRRRRTGAVEEFTSAAPSESPPMHEGQVQWKR